MSRTESVERKFSGCGLDFRIISCPAQVVTMGCGRVVTMGCGQVVTGR